jgi:hypothetical protein
MTQERPNRRKYERGKENLKKGFTKKENRWSREGADIALQYGRKT